MARVQAGDEPALAALMTRWELPLKGLLLRFLSNHHDASDLAQETFVRVWLQRDKFRPGAEFRPWLFAIAVNLARNRLRWWRRRPEVTLEAWSGEDGAEHGAAAVVRRERAEAVRAAVMRLPRDLQEAVVLAEYENLPQAEIATITGSTVKAVESRLYRARAALRSSLARWLD